MRLPAGDVTFTGRQLREHRQRRLDRLGRQRRRPERRRGPRRRAVVGVETLRVGQRRRRGRRQHQCRWLHHHRRGVPQSSMASRSIGHRGRRSSHGTAAGTTPPQAAAVTTRPSRAVPEATARSRGGLGNDSAGARRLARCGDGAVDYSASATAVVGNFRATPEPVRVRHFIVDTCDDINGSDARRHPHRQTPVRTLDRRVGNDTVTGGDDGADGRERHLRRGRRRRTP